MKGNKQLISIGLEGGEPSVIDAMIEAGRLPNIAAMVRSGKATHTRSCTEISSGATWASINTGVNPAAHGLAFYHRQLDSGSYNIVKRYASDIKVEPFWHELARRGYKVAVLDIPDTYVDKDFKETMIVGWGAEGLNAPCASHPSSLLREIENRFGKHPLNNWYQTRPTNHEGWVDLLRVLIDATRQRTRIYKWILERESYDYFFGGYPEPHWVGHFFWHLRDSRHPEYDEGLAKLCGDAVEQIYEVVDEGIGEIRAGYPDADYMVFSNTGMGPLYTGLHLIQEILDRVGLGVQQDESKPPSPLDRIKPQKLWGAGGIRKIENIVGLRTLNFVKRLIPEKLWDVTTRRFLQWGHGWETSKAFVIPSDQSAAIRINLKGREPQGRVEPGAEFDSVVEEIKTVLMEAINPETGESPIREIFLTRDRYVGENSDDFGDITVNWKHDVYVRALESPRFGRVEGMIPDVRTGRHADMAYFMASGPSLAEGGELRDSRIEDIAPTIFRYFDESVPEYMDGEPLTEIFLDKSEASLSTAVNS